MITPKFPRLNVGCGRMLLPQWVNVDYTPYHDPVTGLDVDALVNLDNRNKVDLPFPEDSFDEILMSHVIEHIQYPLPLMQELWRVAKPGAVLGIRCPYGSSDDAWEDPTHIRLYFMGSWRYFSQPIYWRANYGYTADWNVETVTLQVAPGVKDVIARMGLFTVAGLHFLRNCVQEQIIELTCIKPARQPYPNYIPKPELKIVEGS